MSTKLNAKELAEKMFPSADKDLSFSQPWREAAKHTIRNIAQPIADERDELLALVTELTASLEKSMAWVSGGNLLECWETLRTSRAILAKYQNQANKQHA